MGTGHHKYWIPQYLRCPVSAVSSICDVQYLRCSVFAVSNICGLQYSWCPVFVLSSIVLCAQPKPVGPSIVLCLFWVVLFVKKIRTYLISHELLLYGLRRE